MPLGFVSVQYLQTVTFSSPQCVPDIVLHQVLAVEKVTGSLGEAVAVTEGGHRRVACQRRRLVVLPGASDTLL